MFAAIFKNGGGKKVLLGSHCFFKHKTLRKDPVIWDTV